MMRLNYNPLRVPCSCRVKVELMYYSSIRAVDQVGIRCTRCHAYLLVRPPDHIPEKQKDKYALIILRRMNSKMKPNAY